MHNLEEDYLDIKYLTNRMRQVLYNVLINNYLVGEVEYIIYIYKDRDKAGAGGAWEIICSQGSIQNMSHNRVTEGIFHLLNS